MLNTLEFLLFLLDLDVPLEAGYSIRFFLSFVSLHRFFIRFDRVAGITYDFSYTVALLGVGEGQSLSTRNRMHPHLITIDPYLPSSF